MKRLVLGPHPLIAQRLGPGHYSWTLASILGDMLQIAQKMFGERDHAYTLLGIEFCGDHPRVWCPGNRRDLLIQLSVDSMDAPERACYQLAHECIHLLGPQGCSGATVLEEGLATWFAQYYLAERIGNSNWRSTMPSYTDAQHKVEALLALDPKAIRVLRAEQPTIGKIDADLLLKHYSVLGADLASELAAPFVRESDGEDLGSDRDDSDET